MNIWKAIFGGDFSAGSRELKDVEVKEIIIKALGPKAKDIGFDMMDNNYLALTRSNLDAVVGRSVRLDQIRYHSNSSEFPDCDDYAAIARAQVIREAILGKIKYAPCFFIATVTLVGGGGHALNISVTADNKVFLYEPQTDKWDSSFSNILSFDEVLA